MKGVLLNQAASHTGCEEWLRGCDIITVLYRSIMYILREKKLMRNNRTGNVFCFSFYVTLGRLAMRCHSGEVQLCVGRQSALYLRIILLVDSSLPDLYRAVTEWRERG